MHSFIKLTLPVALIISCTAAADTFQLTSTDIQEGQLMNSTQEFKGFGCEGNNQSPQLSWSGAPEGTEAFAIQVYDPDAPTGSGWWHWQVVNIPKDINSLKAGAGELSKNLIPATVTHIKNDYGSKGFGGACPPKGHGLHRYQFTVHALSKKIDLPVDASAALAGYMVIAHSLGSSTLEALYQRD